MKSVFLVFLGGGLGAFCRHLMYVFTSRFSSFSTFPFATTAVNVLGCFLLGVSVGIFSKWTVRYSATEMFFVTGFLGSFTTFSTFIRDAVRLTQSGEILQALGYAALSLFLGLMFFRLGILLVEYGANFLKSY